MAENSLNLIHSELINNLIQKKSKIGIIGLGYVGLPLSIAFSESGYKVVGFDIDYDKVNKINDGKSYINHLPNSTIKKLKKSKTLYATCDFSQSKEPDALILCLPTPLNKNRVPDLSFIEKTLDSIIPYLRKGQIISLESTTYPGTTEDIIKERISQAGFKVGEEIFVVYSPEREDPGNKDFNTSNIPKIIAGISENCLKAGLALYEDPIKKLVVVSNTRTAEMTKLLENIHRAVNIGLMNELKPLADRMKIDLYEVIKAASTKPFGFVPYYPGPGLGGHCIPIDPFYLTWKAREFDMNTKFIELAGEINTSMPIYVVEKTIEALNSVRKPLMGSKILILGLSYKKNIDDIRESPTLEIMEIIKKKGGVLSYSDPFFEKLPTTRRYQYDLSSIDINQSNISNFDVVILTTDHDQFDYELIEKNAKLIIDTRGRFKVSNKIIRA